MKFKYNSWEKKLWRIEDDYFYQVSEENRFIEYITYIGVKTGFKLGESHWLIFRSGQGLETKITAYYTKSLKNGQTIYYEKEINPGWFQFEIIIEFTAQDQVEKNLRGHWTPN